MKGRVMLISTVLGYIGVGMNITLALFSLAIIRRAKKVFALMFAACALIGLLSPAAGLILNVMELVALVLLVLYMMYDGFRTMHW